MLERRAYVLAAVVLCVWLSVVGVGLALGGRTRSPFSAQPQPTSSNRALISAAGSTFEAMLARRKHSVLTAAVGRSTGGRSVAASRSYEKLLSYQQSPGVATNGASSQRVGFSLWTLPVVIVDVARHQHHRPLSFATSLCCIHSSSDFHSPKQVV